MTPSKEDPDDATSVIAVEHASSLRGQRSQWIMIIVLSLAVFYVIYQQVSTQYQANVANDTAKDLAEPVDKLCRADPSVRREIGNAKCDRAAEVQQEPSVVAVPRDGKNGKDGKNGRGITSTDVVNGRLFVTYTDGTREDKGKIAVDGSDGRGITGARLNETGSLVLTYTDGTSETVGRIVGRDGDDGRGIANVVVSDDYHVIVTYTNGTVDDVGTLPPGPAGPAGATGKPGRGVVTVDFNFTECTATIYYTNDTSEIKKMTGCQSSEPTTTTPTTTSITPTG